MKKDIGRGREQPIFFGLKKQTNLFCCEGKDKKEFLSNSREKDKPVCLFRKSRRKGQIDINFMVRNDDQICLSCLGEDVGEDRQIRFRFSLVDRILIRSISEYGPNKINLDMFFSLLLYIYQFYF